MLFLLLILNIIKKTNESVKRTIILLILFLCFIQYNFSQNEIVRTKQIAPTHSYDVLNYKLNLDLFDCYGSSFPKRYYATNIITLKADSTLNSIKLNASNSSLTIDSVQMGGISFTQISDTLTIILDGTYYPGDTAIVKIYYHHNDITTNMSDTAFHACDDGFVFTDTEPEGARKWFPCWDKPADKATTDFTAKVPLNVKLGSNGSLIDSLIVGDSLYYHWASIDPMSTYLVYFGSKDNYNLEKLYWHRPSDYNDSIPVVFYYINGFNISPIKNSVLSVMDYYSDIFGEYPFEKIGYAFVNTQTYYGCMENQTLINMMQYNYTGPETHEIAHQWFGDMITCKTWADIFLNEGFATYIDALWKEHVSSYFYYKNQIINNANSYFYSNPGWAISDSSWAVHTPSFDTLFNFIISYAKGSCVLHMLRYVLGDSLFFRSIKEYATDTNFTYGNATINDFKDKVEEVTNQDLHWFFDEWIFKPNHPVYHNVYNITEIGDSTWTVDFLIEQTQTNTSFFKMPVDLTFRFIDGTDTVIKVMNDTNNQLFTFIFTKRPTNAYFDKDNNIVLKQATTVMNIEDLDNKTNCYLGQNVPNPFNYTTTIPYFVPSGSKGTLTITDIGGEIINTYTLTDGSNKLDISLTGYKSGLYFYKLNIDNGRITRYKKMIVEK